MARTKKACKNHPHRLSSRRCYYCHEHICNECQQKYEHHIFCSRWCYVRWKTEQFFKKVKINKIADLPLLFLLAVIVLSNLFLFLYFNQKISNLRSEKKSLSMVEQKDSLYFQIDSTFNPVWGRTSFKIKVSPGLTASLWHNGQMVKFATEQGGQIVFNNLKLRYGQNRITIWAHQPDGKTQLIDSLNLFFSSARLKYLSKPVVQVPTKNKWLAITFDAGSTNRGTRQILEILRDKKIRCTMFITGQFLKHFPDDVLQMRDDGHEIGNHTFNHPHLTTYARNHLQKNGEQVNRDFVIGQLLKVDSMYFQLSGRHLAPFWRAPFGEYNQQILNWAAEAGFKHIGWSAKCDALDWTVDSTQTLYRSAQEILQHFLNLEAKAGLAGKIILMHLGTDRTTDFPFRILPALIDSLRNRGYRFVTVSELLNQQLMQ